MESISKKNNIVETLSANKRKPVSTSNKRGVVKSIQKTLRRSERIRYNSRAKHEYTDILSRKINHLRRVAKDNIGERNVAKAIIKYSSSDVEEFTAVSGVEIKVGLPVPRKRAFTIFDVRHDRSYDAEVKILEYLDKHIKIYSRASVYLHSELPVCDSCRQVIQQFKEKNKNIKIFISYSLLDQL